METKERQDREHRLEAIELVSTLLQQVPLSKQETVYEMPEDNEYDYLAYVPWIMEDFPQLQKETFVQHILAYLKEE